MHSYLRSLNLFDINQNIHNISNELIEAIVNPSIDFFDSSPLYPLRDLPRFRGAGVYGIFLTSRADTIYDGRLPIGHPIYIGKAVPSGSRQGRVSIQGNQLRSRLRKHFTSINNVMSLDANNFECRFMVINDAATDMIGAIESHLIRKYTPLWNSYIDGFGINAPGLGRVNQQPSEWDTLHPGRHSVANLTGLSRDIDPIMEKIVCYNSTLRT